MASTLLTDTFRHKGLRKKLIDLLRTKGITDENVLNAMNTIPRHYFFDSSFLEFAYEDKAFPIGSGQTISQPYTVAFQSELLQVEKGMRVLEVGTGSGYQASVLAEMGARVFTIERQKLLYDNLKSLNPPLSYRIRLFYGDGYAGLPAFAPFDRILITAAAPFIPIALVAQLKIGGRLVAPVGKNDIQIMTLVTKLSETEIKTETFGTFRFVPMLTDKAQDL
ncbi:MAG: protein-L-isoaspartate(D-aspartate) O-methyltransferase [Bacteroidales bacterium]|nr:protein-L-isoaspartate(D-aspartate) O-methyltransferase [Bacteroidales bacterium]